MAFFLRLTCVAHHKSDADDGGRMTIEWFAYLAVGAALSVYGIYLLRQK